MKAAQFVSDKIDIPLARNTRIGRVDGVLSIRHGQGELSLPVSNVTMYFHDRQEVLVWVVGSAVPLRFHGDGPLVHRIAEYLSDHVPREDYEMVVPNFEASNTDANTNEGEEFYWLDDFFTLDQHRVPGNVLYMQEYM